ncbi:uncharacterized protein LOC115426782 [Sphaeramia orbicularis]|uniref:uncharacterized protein LOC115426782 n=1 Tax=Sphaeramia orbicularis TaxID=375764 RepID=UPI00117F35C7|nr:uncharacterized protein LOC115426782 [Sphaeramia orbicularis]
MVMRDILLYILFGHLLRTDVCLSCVPSTCLKCTSNGEPVPDPCDLLCSHNTSQCYNDADIPRNCTKDFQVSINGTGSKVNEGASITLTCIHNLPEPVELKWKKDGRKIEGNSTKLTLEKLLTHHSGQYVCNVTSSCGSFESASHNVTVNNGAVIIVVISGVSALALVVIMGVLMKYKLKRDNEKSMRRQRQRAEAARHAGPAPLAPRES